MFFRDLPFLIFLHSLKLASIHAAILFLLSVAVFLSGHLSTYTVIKIPLSLLTMSVSISIYFGISISSNSKIP